MGSPASNSEARVTKQEYIQPDTTVGGVKPTFRGHQIELSCALFNIA